MYIKDENIIIRNAEIKDAKQIQKWWDDGKVMNHAGFPKGLNITLDSVENSIVSCNDNNQLLIVQIDNISIGEMNYRIENNIAEIGIKICDFSLHSKGLGTRCITILINYIFNDLGCDKIEVNTNLNNEKARKLYEKIGFKEVKIEIDSWKNQLGEVQSTIFYELHKKDFN